MEGETEKERAVQQRVTPRPYLFSFIGQTNARFVERRSKEERK